MEFKVVCDEITAQVVCCRFLFLQLVASLACGVGSSSFSPADHSRLLLDFSSALDARGVYNVSGVAFEKWTWPGTPITLLPMGARAPSCPLHETHSYGVPAGRHAGA